MNAPDTSLCPICSSPDTTELIDIPGAPVFCNVVHATKEAAENAPSAPILLRFCEHCWHIFHAGFRPRLLNYGPDYENSLHFSKHFDSYARSTAEQLSRRHGLTGKTILEIGCGDGDFLRMLCDGGKNHGVGFDPALGDELDLGDDSIEFIADTFSEKYAHYTADMICCRQVLEHVPDPRGFVGLLQSTAAARAGTQLFFEVPNALFILKELSIWDIIYEHYSYFTAPSLRGLFERCGFVVDSVADAFHGQYLCIEARSPAQREHAPIHAACHDEVAEAVREFSRLHEKKSDEWNEKLAQFHSNGQRGVVWGAGSKGVMFVNTQETLGTIARLVDINPRKHGRYVGGSAQKVVAPDELREERPDFVILMNSAYKAEVEGSLSSLGIETRVVVA